MHTFFFIIYTTVLNLLVFVPAPVVSRSIWSYLHRYHVGGDSTSVLRVPQNRLSQISQHSSLLIPPYPTDPAFSPYSTALELLRTLSTKSSCYVEATSSLVADCSVLQDDTIDDSVKVIYAVYLAICELKSTGVSYPKECNDLKNSGTPKRQVCIKKLEEKPQYWTTLSNNLQNALVICAATRQEVEREKLLSLHLNITKVQQNLFNAAEGRIAESLAVIHDTREWGQEMKRVHEEVLKFVHNIKDLAVDTLMDNNAKTSETLSELTRQIKFSQEMTNTLLGELGKSRNTLTQVTAGVILRLTDGLNQLEESSREITDEQGRLLRENTVLVQELRSSLAFTKDFTVDTLARFIENLSFGLRETLKDLRNVQISSTSLSDSFLSLSEFYKKLESTGSEITSALKLHKDMQVEMLFSLEKAAENMDYSMVSLAQGMEKLRDNVDAIEDRVRGFWLSKFSTESIIASISGFIIIALLGKNQMPWVMGVLSGLWALTLVGALFDNSNYLTPAKKFGEMLQRPPNTDLYISLPPRIISAWTWVLGLFFIMTMCLYWCRDRDSKGMIMFRAQFLTHHDKTQVANTNTNDVYPLTRSGKRRQLKRRRVNDLCIL